MFYGKDSIEHQFNLVKGKLEEQELFIFEPMPDYKLNERWTDEYRIRDGHTKLADGSWVTIHKLTTYLETIQKNTEEVYDRLMQCYRDLDVVKQQRTEMEFGLRHAQKSLHKALAIKGENDE
jgi:hypothetical protein